MPFVPTVDGANALATVNGVLTVKVCVPDTVFEPSDVTKSPTAIVLVFAPVVTVLLNWIGTVILHVPGTVAEVAIGMTPPDRAMLVDPEAAVKLLPTQVVEGAGVRADVAAIVMPVPIVVSKSEKLVMVAAEAVLRLVSVMTREA
jgi:hypothetical protein